MSNGVELKGTTYNHDGTVILPESVVRLYNLDTGLLEDFGVSDVKGDYEFPLAPQNYGVLSYRIGDGTAGIVSGSHTGSVTPEHLRYHWEGLMMDANKDILQIKVLDPTDVKVHLFKIISSSVTTRESKFELRNAADGGGDAIEVIFPAGGVSAQGVGPLTVTDYLYIRVVKPGKNVNTTDFDIWFTYP